ncbi:MAG TPA: aminotransferase class IV [Acidimicrobiia bacterium]|nr:aminotransferase class IV [Acidimicrobiia bacterium]
MIVWCDGHLVDGDRACISPFDHGLTVGDGVFETLRVHRGVPFAWRRHHERLVVSAAGLELPLPDPAELRAAADAVIDANRLTEARLRVTITGGPAGPASHRGSAPPTVLIVAAPIDPTAEIVDLVTSPWPRNERSALAGIKAISYAENVRVLLHARRHGAHDGLFCDTRGRVCETTGANVFTVSDGIVRTPALDTGCLPGVTRALVMEECSRSGMHVEEATLRPDDVAGAAEAFLTSSVAGVRAIRSLDGNGLRAAPGPVTARARDLLAELMATRIDP